jgi:hypothetical protein
MRNDRAKLHDTNIFFGLGIFQVTLLSPSSDRASTFQGKTLRKQLKRPYAPRDSGSLSQQATDHRLRAPNGTPP